MRLALAVGGVLLVGCIEHDLVPCGTQLCPTEQTCTPLGCAQVADVQACDGKLESDACDSDNVTRGACHSGVCVTVTCGDERSDLDEVCDDGNNTDGDGCSATCDSNETCGNMHVDTAALESCDSGVAGLSHDGCSSRCQLESAEWVDVPYTPINARLGPMMATDAARGEIVAFGGYDQNGYRNDTWVWDGTRWWPRVVGKSPSARVGGGIAFDAARGVVVLFGGQATSGFLADTWIWDGTTWTERTPPVSPSVRAAVQLAYDASRQRIVLFGGYPLSNDTWEWDGQTWTQATTASAPPGRFYHSLAYDEVHHEVLLYGGTDLSAELTDTWTWNGTTWSPHSTTSVPTGFSRTSLMFDPNRNVLSLFGGDKVNNGGATNEVWEWSGTDWALRTATGGPPLQRVGAGWVYDPVSDEMLLFGGGNGSPLIPTFYDDVWHWSGTTWTPVPAIQYGPFARGGAGFAYDPLRGEAIAFGGLLIGTSNETWRYRNHAWIRATPTTIPSGRTMSSLTYDPVRRRMVMFGGNGGAALGDTWEWDGDDWLPQTPTTSPPPRFGHAAVFDEKRGTIVIFGGTDDVGARNDAWEWNGSNWAPLVTTGAPPPRQGVQLVYDAAHERFVLFGGASSLTFYSDTWQLVGTTWSKLDTPVHPSERSYGSLSYDPVRRILVLSGGIESLLRADTWELDGSTWSVRTELTIAPHWASNAIYHPIEQRTLMFGGFGNFTLHSMRALETSDRSAQPESCLLSTLDEDGDGRAGCSDPDCWGRCAPLCTPGSSCPSTAPRCGDGACGAVEDHALCPADCP